MSLQAIRLAPVGVASCAVVRSHPSGDLLNLTASRLVSPPSQLNGPLPLMAGEVQSLMDCRSVISIGTLKRLLVISYIFIKVASQFQATRVPFSVPPSLY